MKKLLITLIALCSVMCSVNAQKIRKNEIDKFTKTRVVETTNERICNPLLSLYKQIWASFYKNGDSEFLRLYWFCGDIISMDKGNKVIFLDAEENPYTFHNSQYVMAQKGINVPNVISSHTEHLLEMWLVGDLSIFEEKNITAMRIYTNQGYEDIKLGKRIEKLKELYLVYKEALE